MQVALRPVEENGATVVHVSGSLEASGTPLLRDLLAQTGSRVVDLDELVTTSSEGLAALHDLAERGVHLRNASPFLTLRLAALDEREQRS